MASSDTFAEFRELMAGFKRSGATFDRAWHAAHSRIVFPHEKPERHLVYTALEETREEWRAAFEDRDPPRGATALVTLASLAGELHEREAQPAPIHKRLRT